MPKVVGGLIKITDSDVSSDDSDVIAFQEPQKKKKCIPQSSSNTLSSGLRKEKAIESKVTSGSDDGEEEEDDDKVTPLLFDTTTSKAAVKTFSKKKNTFAVSTNSFLGKAKKFNFNSSTKRSETTDALKDASDSDNDFDNIEERIRDKIVLEREKNKQSKNTYFKSYHNSSVLPPQSSVTKPARMRGDRSMVEKDIYDFADSDSDKKTGVFSRPKTEFKQPVKRKAKSEAKRSTKTPKTKPSANSKKSTIFFNDNASENSERSYTFGSQVSSQLSDTSETRGGQSPGGTHLTMDVSWDEGNGGKKTYSAPTGYTIQPFPLRKGLQNRDDNR